VKIKAKILLCSIVPIVILSVLSILLSGIFMKNNITKAAYAGMQSTAITIANTYTYASEGEFYVGDDGCLCKGDMDLEDNIGIIDDIKTNTGLDVTVFYGDTRYLTTIVNEAGERQTGTKANDDVVESVLNNGVPYSDDNVNILGTRYIAYYIPLYQEGTTTPIGMIFLGDKYENVNALIYKAQSNMAFCVIVIMIFASIFAYTIGNGIARSMVRAVKDLGLLADRKLNVNLDKKILARKDEIGLMYNALQQVDEHLSNTIQGVQNQSIDLMNGAGDSMNDTENVKEAVEQIFATVEEVTASVIEQNEEVDNTNVAVEEMGEMIQNTASEMEKINIQTKEMETASNIAKEEMETLKKNMSIVLKAVEEIAEQTQNTKVATDRISEAAYMVSNIADETNLLALNASIEAARAGEAGRGFAVVADEIQKLAEQSNNSANQIQEMLRVLQRESVESVTKMGDVTDKVKEQEHYVEDATTKVDLLSEGIAATSESVEAASAMIEPLLERKNDIVERMKFMGDSSQNISASMQETSASIQVVAEMAGRLNDQAVEIKNVAETLEGDMSVFEFNN